MKLMEVTLRPSIIALVVVVGLIVLLSRRRIFRVVRDFFTEEGHPVDLAVFRIVWFSVLLVHLLLHRVEILNFSALPRELLVAPTGLDGILPHVPINPTLVGIAWGGLVASVCLAIVGLYTRPAAWASVALGIYVLGIPQFYGKVNHYHHLLWFAAILAASRCADALSVDAIRKAWKRADQGLFDEPAKARAYALPLRFIWLLVGIIYLFPGLYKFYSAGITWSGQQFMYSKWLELGGWFPPIRPDHFPLVGELVGPMTILFEVSVIVLIFTRRGRLMAAGLGIFFHSMTNFTMRISFLALQMSYVSFFRWHQIFRRIGERIYAEQMVIVFDGGCKVCRRTIATLRVVDIFKRIGFVDALDDTRMNADPRLRRLDSVAVLTDMHVVVGDRSWVGYDAYRKIGTRVPLFWPLVPMLHLPPIEALGRAIYRKVAHSRACSVTDGRETAPRPAAVPAPGLVLKLTAGFLLATTLSFGGLAIRKGWPVDSYPWFSGEPTTKQLITMAVVDGSGTERPVEPLDVGGSLGWIPSERYWGLVRGVLRPAPEGERLARLEAFWNVVEQYVPTPAGSTTVRFYEDTLILKKPEDVPGGWGNPVHREFLAELALEPAIASTNRRASGQRSNRLHDPAAKADHEPLMKGP